MTVCSPAPLLRTSLNMGHIKPPAATPSPVGDCPRQWPPPARAVTRAAAQVPSHERQLREGDLGDRAHVLEANVPRDRCEGRKVEGCKRLAARGVAGCVLPSEVEVSANGGEHRARVDGANAVAVEDDSLAPHGVVQPDSATADAAAAPCSLELRGRAVCVEACAHASAKGKPCAHIAAAGAGSSCCQNHTCQHAGCAESKSSQQRFCTRHIATSSFAADAGVHDVALDAEGSGASTHTAEAPRPSGYFLASATGGADTDVGRPGASSTVGSKPRTPGRGKGASGIIQTGRHGDAAVSRSSQALEMAGQSGALPHSVVP